MTGLPLPFTVSRCPSDGPLPAGAVAPEVTAPPGAPAVTCGNSSRACPGNSNKMVAVAAVSALTAIPDTRASLFILDPLPRHPFAWMRGAPVAAVTQVGVRAPRAANTFAGIFF